MIFISLEKLIAAPASDITDVLLDHQNLSRFFNARFALMQTQDGGERLGGKGTIRQVTIGKSTFNEKIIHAENEHITYQIIGKGPVSNHQGDIFLRPVTENTSHESHQNTLVNYQIRCSGPKWLPEFLVKAFIAKDIRSALSKLERYFR